MEFFQAIRYPPEEPGALFCEPLNAALCRTFGALDALLLQYPALTRGATIVPALRAWVCAHMRADECRNPVAA